MILHSLESSTLSPLPVAPSRIHAGFPSPAEQYQHETLDLNELVVKHPSATYYAWAEGDSMELAGIFGGDLLVIDKSEQPRHGDVVIAAINGELACKRLNLNGQVLESNSPNDYACIPCTPDVTIEGVVINSVRMHR
jgi:DNA polymerase V